MALHNKLGRAGEEAALAFLQQAGLQVLHSNWRTHPWEVDIVALDGKILVFVEVKTRADLRHGLPEEAVTRRKEQHLYSSAEAYLEKYGMENEVRFDIMAVLPKDGGWQIRHIPGAFSAFGG
ncbi:MAG: YraN family protein [Bacteroidia bacterium]|nr:YraN family protein [Bacteroidia bacterium]